MPLARSIARPIGSSEQAGRARIALISRAEPLSSVFGAFAPPTRAWKTRAARYRVRMLRHLFGELFQKGKRPMLDIGDPAPAFELEDHLGRTVKLSDYRGKRVVLWFYPKADTPG